MRGAVRQMMMRPKEVSCLKILSTNIDVNMMSFWYRGGTFFWVTCEPLRHTAAFSYPTCVLSWPHRSVPCVYTGRRPSCAPSPSCSAPCTSCSSAGKLQDTNMRKDYAKKCAMFKPVWTMFMPVWHLNLYFGEGSIMVINYICMSNSYNGGKWGIKSHGDGSHVAWNVSWNNDTKLVWNLITIQSLGSLKA